MCRIAGLVITLKMLSERFEPCVRLRVVEGGAFLPDTSVLAAPCGLLLDNWQRNLRRAFSEQMFLEPNKRRADAWRGPQLCRGVVQGLVA